MQTKKNWTLIDEAVGGSKLPAGGYVCRITGVEDVPSKEYLWIYFDIAEGQYAGHYSDEYAQKNPYIHRFSRSYKDSAEGFFKAFLLRLEESNRGTARPFSIEQWQVRSDERDFIGLEIGLVFQNEKYTNEKGEDKERLNVVGVYASQDIRNGEFKLPEPEDNRKSASNDDYSDVPFSVPSGDAPSWA